MLNEAEPLATTEKILRSTKDILVQAVRLKKYFSKEPNVEVKPPPRAEPVKTADRKIAFVEPVQDASQSPQDSEQEEFRRMLKKASHGDDDERGKSEHELKEELQRRQEQRRKEMAQLREKAQKELGVYNPPKPKEEDKKYLPVKDDPAILKKGISKVTIADIKQVCPEIEKLKNTRGIKTQWDKVRKYLGVSGNIGEFVRCYLLTIAKTTPKGDMVELLKKFAPREDLQELVSSRMPSGENKSSNTSAKPEPRHKSQPKIDKSDQEILDKQLKDIDVDDLKNVFPQIKELDDDDIMQQWHDLCECLGNEEDETMRVFIEDYGKNALSMWEGREKLYFDGRIINDIFFRFEPREDLFNAVSPETFAKKRKRTPAEVGSKK